MAGKHRELNKKSTFCQRILGRTFGDCTNNGYAEERLHGHHHVEALIRYRRKNFLRMDKSLNSIRLVATVDLSGILALNLIASCFCFRVQ